MLAGRVCMCAARCAGSLYVFRPRTYFRELPGAPLGLVRGVFAALLSLASVFERCLCCEALDFACTQTFMRRAKTMDFLLHRFRADYLL